MDLNNKLIERISEIHKEFEPIYQQENSMEIYLQNYLSIRGFVVDKKNEHASETLYDGHLLGITETNTGEVINDLVPYALYQLNSSKAGFVPIGFPMIDLTKSVIEKVTLCLPLRSESGRFSITP